MPGSQLTIDEKTRISIGLVILLAGGLYSIGWAMFEARAASQKLEKVEAKIESLQSIQTDLAVIRFKVENMESIMAHQPRRR